MPEMHEGVMPPMSPAALVPKDIIIVPSPTKHSRKEAPFATLATASVPTPAVPFIYPQCMRIINLVVSVTNETTIEAEYAPELCEPSMDS